MKPSWKKGTDPVLLLFASPSSICLTAARSHQAGTDGENSSDRVIPL